MPARRRVATEAAPAQSQSQSQGQIKGRLEFTIVGDYEINNTYGDDGAEISEALNNLEEALEVLRQLGGAKAKWKLTGEASGVL